MFILIIIIFVSISSVLSHYDIGEDDRSANRGLRYLFSNIKKNIGRTCFNNFGCFDGQTFHYIKTVVPYLPLSPKYINPEFRLYTAKSKENATLLDHNPLIDDLILTKFNPNFRTILIVHGYRNNLEKWMIAIKDLILKQVYHDYNVILVSWGKGSMLNSYLLAVVNTRIVGAMLAFFINRLCEIFDMRNNMFHIIGHSLGAHIAGFAGKRLFNPKLQTITAMDPAGPGFNEAYPGLEKTDANQVVVIHTDIEQYGLSEGLGNSRILGDIDFFPNGGRLQPGCAYTFGILNSIKALSTKTGSCSHLRSAMMASNLGIPGQFCLPVGYECPDWETFLEGRCADCGKNNTKCYLMGIYPWYWRGIHIPVEQKSVNNERKFYLNTGAVESYCVYHYQIALHVSEDSYNFSGILDIQIQTRKYNRSKFYNIQRKLTKVNPGQIHTLLVTMDNIMDDEETVVIEWNSTSIEEDSFQYLKLVIEFVEINYMSHIYEEIRKEKSKVFCPADKEERDPFDYRLEFKECKFNGSFPESLAKNLQTDSLYPITDYKDLLSVDYLMIDKVAHKVNYSNLIYNDKKSRRIKPTTTIEPDSDSEPDIIILA